jgi:hypothetical protein
MISVSKKSEVSITTSEKCIRESASLTQTRPSNFLAMTYPPVTKLSAPYYHSKHMSMVIQAYNYHALFLLPGLFPLSNLNIDTGQFFNCGWMYFLE